MRKGGRRPVQVARLAVPEMQGTLLRWVPEAYGREVVQETGMPRVPNRTGGGLTRAAYPIPSWALRVVLISPCVARSRFPAEFHAVFSEYVAEEMT